MNIGDRSLLIVHSTLCIICRFTVHVCHTVLFRVLEFEPLVLERQHPIKTAIEDEHCGCRPGSSRESSWLAITPAKDGSHHGANYLQTAISA